MIQEQLSKNRIILEQDPKGVIASITSSTHERKSKSYVFVKNGRVYMKNNTIGDDVPVSVVMKAMGVESDLEFVQLVGGEPELVNALALSLEDAVRLGVHSQDQVSLRFIAVDLSYTCIGVFLTHHRHFATLDRAYGAALGLRVFRRPTPSERNRRRRKKHVKYWQTLF